MSLSEALATIAQVGPFVFAAGVLAGYRPHLGRNHDDRRH